MEYFPKSDFLKCRLTCKTWQQDLDTVHQNHPKHLDLGGLSFPGPKQRSRVLVFGGMKAPQYGNSFGAYNIRGSITAFLANMSNHPGNPFPGRSVAINFRRLLHDEQRNVTRLLDQFGHQIRYLLIMLDENAPQAFAEPLKNCLLRVPNLKKLEILFNGRILNGGFKGNFQLNHLPTLHSLESSNAYNLHGLVTQTDFF